MKKIEREMSKNEPSEVNYTYVYWLLEEWKRESEKTKDDVLILMSESQYENYLLRVEFAQRNLDEIGVDDEIEVDYDKVKTDYLIMLILSSMKKIDKDMEALILAMLMTKTTSELYDFIKSDKTVEQVTSKVMRIYRTENTQMRTDYVIMMQSILEGRGKKVRRQWLHTLSNPNVSVSEGYTPRNDHVALNGMFEDENGEFTTASGNTTSAPGMFGVPSEDINCRCDVVFVVD